MNGVGRFFGNGRGSSATKFALVIMMISMGMIGAITAMATIIQAF